MFQLKYEFCTVLGHYIDEFSFKVLSNISSNMEMSGLMQANHKFLSEVFNTELYALRDIPQPPQKYGKSI